MERAEEEAVVVPECVVCLQPFDGTHHIPRVLSCGHSLCQSCVSTISIQDADLRSSFLRCPECNQRSKLPLTGASGLPKNIALLRFIPTQSTDTHRSINRNIPLHLRSSSLFDASLSELRSWIIPQNSVRLLDGSADRPQLNHVVSGEISLSGDENVKHSYSATLLPIDTVWSSTHSKNLKNAKDLQYLRRIESLLEFLTKQQRRDLFHLLRISMLHERVCTIFGFWMSAEGRPYLVCKASTKESQYLWQVTDSQVKLGAGKRILRLPCSRKEVEPPCNLTKMNGIMQIGREICELLVGLHREGLVAGFITPKCLLCNEFLHLRLDINAFLCLRKSLKDYLTIAQHEETGIHGQSEPLLQGSKPQMEEELHLYYGSPELLSNLGLKSSSHASITYKTDAWTLGCLLCNLCFGETPWDGLAIQDHLQNPINPMERAELWLGERIRADFAELDDPVLATDDPSTDFLRVLARCFAHTPEDRPDIIEIWHLLNNIETSVDLACDSLEVRSFECFWCLALECDINLSKEHAQEEQGTPMTYSKETANAEVSQLPGSLSGRLEGDDDEVGKISFLDGHSGYVTCLLVCGQYLLSASFDKSICVWSLNDAILLKTLKGHAHRVMAMAADQQSLLCISGDYGGEICIWELKGAAENYRIKWYEHQDWRYSGVASLAISEDHFLYSGSGDKSIKVWSLQDHSLIATMEGHKSLVSALLIDTEVLFSGSWDGTIRLWWRSDHSPLAVLGESSELGAVRALAITADLLLAGYHSGKIQVWRDEACLNLVAAHDGVISSLCLYEDVLFSGSWDGSIKVWNVLELPHDATSRLVTTCGSPVTSLVCYDEKLYAGLSTNMIAVHRL